MQLTATFRAAALATVLATALAACGQKPGVHVDNGPGGVPLAGAEAGAQGGAGQQGAAPGDQQSGATAGQGDATSADGGASVGAGAGGAGGAAGAAGGGGATAGGTTGGGAAQGGGGATGGGGGGDTQQGSDAAPDQQQAEGGQRQVSGSDRTGVGDEVIRLGVHAPATGAAPLPTTSFEQSRDLYWRHVTEELGQTVLGRSRVEVAYRDDKYAPDSAVQVCRELAAEAFTVVGGGGTDQIQACGRLAGVNQFPYFSGGVTETGLTDNPWYFAASMTYRQQGSVLAQYVAKNPDGLSGLDEPVIGTIVTDTPNFSDAEQGWLQGLEQVGLSSANNYRHPKGDTSWYAEAARQMQQAGVTVLYMNTAPVDYIQFANVANERFGYNPQYVGVGITMALNAVLQSGCGGAGIGIDDGVFLSPFPGLDWARQNLPEFFAAGETFGAPTDDIALALWGLAATQHELFERYEATFGTDLTREDFRALVESSTGIESGVFPRASFSPQQHFGGEQAHVLQADCGSREHTTLQAFATGF